MPIFIFLYRDYSEVDYSDDDDEMSYSDDCEDDTDDDDELDLFSSSPVRKSGGISFEIIGAF